MPVKEKTRLWLWLGLGVGGALLVAAAVLILLLSKPQPTPPEPSTAGTTEATLPENPLKPEDFGYQGDYLTCLTRESVLGIDVSYHQKEIDWQQVKDAGVEFVMLRLAYRGSIEGALSTDIMAQQNYEGAKAAGLKIGGYIFTQSINPQEGREDAAYVLDIVNGWELDMPLVYDWEVMDPSYRNANLDPRTLTDTMLAFCQAIEAAGYDAMVYFNPSQARVNFYPTELTDYGFWLANYAETLNYPHTVDMWQYPCTGRVPGIKGNVDIDLYFPPEEE